MTPVTRRTPITTYSRRTWGFFTTTLLVGLLWPREARLSGSMSATGIGRSYKLTVYETGYAIGRTNETSDAEAQAEQRAWRERLADAMTVTDQWLATQSKDKKVALGDLTLHTAMVAPIKAKPVSGTLRRPTLVDLPPCERSAPNLTVAVQLVLTTLPTAAERTALGSSLCAQLKAARPADKPLPLAAITELQTQRDVMKLALDGNFYVPASTLTEIDKLRADFFQQAGDVMVRSCRRFEKAHPGVTLRRIGGTGGELVRFGMEAPFGNFDVLTEMVAAPGAKLPHAVALKDTMYQDWRAAGLPMQVELPALLKTK